MDVGEHKIGSSFATDRKYKRAEGTDIGTCWFVLRQGEGGGGIMYGWGST